MIVVVGESLIDIVPSGEYVGGGPLNIAIGLARLDEDVALITQLGDDDHGRRIREHLRANDVDLIASATASGRSSTAAAALDEDGVADYDFDLEWSLPDQRLPHCDALHVGSLGTVLEPGRDRVLDLVDQARDRDVFVSYDPNLRRQFLGDAAQTWGDVEALADRAALVKLSADDVDLVHPGADPADIARSLLDGEGTGLVVVTHGADGSTGYAPGVSVHVPTPTSALVDTVGAGDSFMAAMLAILSADRALTPYGPGLPADEAALTRLLRGAATAAAITCRRAGADPPRRSELPEDWPA